MTRSAANTHARAEVSNGEVAAAIAIASHIRCSDRFCEPWKGPGSGCAGWDRRVMPLVNQARVVASYEHVRSWAIELRTAFGISLIRSCARG